MKHIDTLIGILKEIRDTLKKLAELSETKQKLLIKGDAQAVSELVKEEMNWMETLSDQEQTRMDVTLLLQSEWNTGNGSLTLKEIGSRTGDAEKKELEALGLEMKQLVARQKALNDQNAQLIQLHFEYMNFMKYFMLQDVQTSDIYGNSGIVKEMDMNVGIIDSRV